MAASAKDEAAGAARLAMLMGSEASSLSLASLPSAASFTAFTIEPPSSLAASQWDADEMADLEADGHPVDRQAGPQLDVEGCQRLLVVVMAGHRMGSGREGPRGHGGEAAPEQRLRCWGMVVPGSGAHGHLLAQQASAWNVVGLSLSRGRCAKLDG